MRGHRDLSFSTCALFRRHKFRARRRFDAPVLFSLRKKNILDLVARKKGVWRGKNRGKRKQTALPRRVADMRTEILMDNIDSLQQRFDGVALVVLRCFSFRAIDERAPAPAATIEKEKKGAL
ncbi:hypothetical protein pclt_cds_350 [Pandoravirus celtis]|uniref:Uncharacterized protein n=1 Tax=Pandoravirus celtis TaxID=2568002 RepID=A0A4D6EHH7_9VIRU|nr:hypothetical protein pclt_cds_350 [Pandoravirus celtis]